MLQLPIYTKDSAKGKVYEINALRFNFTEEAELYQASYALADSDSCNYTQSEVEAIAKFISYNFNHIEGLINRIGLSEQNQCEKYAADFKLDSVLASIEDIKNQLRQVIVRNKAHIEKVPTDRAAIGCNEAYEEILALLNTRFSKI